MSQVAQLRGASVSLGGRPVLADLGLDLVPADVVGVSGPNGSGKTTLVRALATLVPLSGGAGTVLNAELGTPGVYTVRSSIGMISHTPAVIAQLTLRENLIHVARLAGIDIERVDKVLDVVGLGKAADRATNQSSFGMKRRIEVAGLLLRRPRLLLLDEAMSGLDREARDLIGALIDRTVSGEGSVIIVSHDPRQFEGLTTGSLQLSDGRLVKAS